MIAHSGSSQLLWKLTASRPIGVTCIWMPLRPSGSPTPGVGIMWPTLPYTIGAVAAGGVAAVAAGAAAAGAFWAGELAWAPAAAGVSAAAAKAIAHPISLICTPDSAWNWERGCAPRFL